MAASFSAVVAAFSGSITNTGSRASGRPTSLAPQPRPARSRRLLQSYTDGLSPSHKPIPYLSAAAIARTDSVLSFCLAESTLNNYDGALSAFHTFCDSENVPPAARLPAGEHLLCAFAASRAGTHAKTSVRNSLSGVRAWHILQGAPWNGGPRLSYVLNGVEALAPKGRPPRPPVTREMLEALHDDLDANEPENACILAAADIAFWTQSRLGELFSTAKASYDPQRVPARSHLSIPSSLHGSRRLHYPYTKTKKYSGDDAIITRQVGSSDPISSLQHHLVRNDMPANFPLFAFRAGDGGCICLTKKHFLRVCNGVWRLRGIPHTTGHSFRIGGTTELLTRGVDPDIVKTMGRWSSDAFLRYWRRIDDIVPAHAQMLRPVLKSNRSNLGSRRRKAKKTVTFADGV
ncbi:hypothetical protein B0H21DRAFT_701128 [Amylocystis lapponica]|nr:hypothetical protein B0H21DRAFT_701128 [Amylocystis lapponica]